MEENLKNETPKSPDIRALIQDAIREFVNLETAKSEPAYKAELEDERRRRETLERRMNELVEENRRSRQVDLAYKAVRDDIQRTDDGRKTNYKITCDRIGNHTDIRVVEVES